MIGHPRFLNFGQCQKFLEIWTTLYDQHNLPSINSTFEEQAADGVRTRDLVLTKHALYQAELRRHTDKTEGDTTLIHELFRYIET